MPKQKPWIRTQLARHRPGTRNERKKYLIVTEGATEKAYFSHFRTSTGPEIIVHDQSDSKLSLVKTVISIRDQRITAGTYSPELDEVWVVLDRDVDPTNPKDKHNFNEALDLANRENILVAYSNDAFELWYLLHFQVVSSAHHRRDLDKKLAKHLGRTYKSRHGSKIEDLFTLINQSQPVAIKRAHALLRQHAGISPEKANPSTAVCLLVEKIINEDGFRIR